MHTYKSLLKCPERNIVFNPHSTKLTTMNEQSHQKDQSSVPENNEHEMRVPYYQLDQYAALS